MRNLHKGLFLLMVLVGFMQCQKELSPTDYSQWITNPKHGLRVEKTAKDYVFQLQYKPKSLMALIEAKGESLSDSAFRALEKGYENMEYYDMSISVQNSGNELLYKDMQQPADYFNKASYFSFEMPKRLTLIVGQDTLPCKLFHFERNYNTAPTSHFSLGFEVPAHAQGDRKLVYNDEILGIDPLELGILQKSILEIPQLKYINKW